MKVSINKKTKHKSKKPKSFVAVNGSCDKYNTRDSSFLTYEPYKRRLTKKEGDRRKKKILCRKNKDSYHILLRSCPNRLMTKKKLKEILSHHKLDVSGNRAELCHRLFLYEINNYPVTNNICTNINGENDFNKAMFRYKNPLDNRYYCIPHKEIKELGNTMIPKIIKDLIK